VSVLAGLLSVFGCIAAFVVGVSVTGPSGGCGPARPAGSSPALAPLRWARVSPRWPASLARSPQGVGVPGPLCPARNLAGSLSIRSEVFVA
jgi:hypothetical protein